MRGGSEDRNTIAETSFRVAGSDASADVRCAPGQYASFGRVRAARAEVHHGAALSDLHDARCLGGDERLKANSGQQVRFDELCLHERRAHGEERFVGEDGSAFAHGEDVAGETELAQRVEETGFDAPELGQPAEVIDLLIGELQIKEIIHRLGKAGGHNVIAIARQAAEKQLESGAFGGFAGFKVTRRQSLQLHYARTLDLWAEALEAHKSEAIAIQSDEVYERYMKYLTGCAKNFRIGYTDVNQFTLEK